MKIKTNTFSGFTLNFAKNQIKKAIQKKDFDELSFWSAELHISRRPKEWFSEIILYCAKHINLSNPNIGKFLVRFKQDFNGLLFDKEIDEKARNAIVFLNGVILFSPKDLELHLPKSFVIESEENKILHDLQTKNVHPFVNMIRKPSDKRLILTLATYLIEAILDQNFQSALKVLALFQHFEKKKVFKKGMQCHARAWKGLNTKFYNKYELFLLDLFCSFAKKRDVVIRNRILNNSSEDTEATNEIFEIMASWRILYIFNTNVTTNQKNFMIIVNCVNLLCSKIRILPTIHNKDKIEKGMQLIDSLYKDIFKAVAKKK